MIKTYHGAVIKAYQFHHGYSKHLFEFVSRKLVPFRDGNETPDAVKIVAFEVNDPTDPRFVAIYEYRPQIKNYIWDVPAGKLNKDETIEECAKRELREETGLRLTKIISVTPHVFPTVGICDEQQALVVCECIGTLTKKHQEKDEVICPAVLTKERLDLILSDKKNLFSTQFSMLRMPMV